MTSQVRYRHTQVALVNLVVLLALVAPLTWYAHRFGNLSALIPGLVFVAGMVWFTTFTVIVTTSGVECRFGPGPLRRRIALASIESVSAVRNSLWQTGGWGIRSIPGGWLWNISGFSAVELRLREGGVFRIGTDEPAQLAQQIEAALADRPGLQGQAGAR